MTNRSDKMLIPWQKAEDGVEWQLRALSGGPFEMAKVFNIIGWWCIVYSSSFSDNGGMEDPIALNQEVSSLEEGKRLAEKILLGMGWEIMDEKVAMLL